MTQRHNPNQKPEPPKPNLAGRAPQQQPAAAKPAVPQRPVQGQPARPGQAPAQQPARGPMAARPAAQAPGQRMPAQPQRPPVALPVKPVNGSPQEIVDYLGGQIQLLATRLEGLRQQGAGETTEFKQLETMLQLVQDKLVLAQARIRRGG